MIRMINPNIARNHSQSLFPGLWDGLQGCWDFRVLPSGRYIHHYGTKPAVGTLFGTPGVDLNGRGGLQLNNGVDASYQFNGSGRVFNFGSGPFSIAVSFQLDSVAVSNGIISQIDNSATLGDFYIWHYFGDSRVRFGRRSASSILSCQSLSNALVAKKVYSIIGTSPTTDDTTIYQDGLFVQRSTATQSYATTSTVKTVMGQIEDVSGRCLGGVLYYCYVWNRVLRPNEVALVADGGSPLQKRPIKYWGLSRANVAPSPSVAFGTSVGARRRMRSEDELNYHKAAPLREATLNVRLASQNLHKDSHVVTAAEFKKKVENR